MSIFGSFWGRNVIQNKKQNSSVVDNSLEITWKKTQHFLHNGALEHRKIEGDRKDYSEREDLGKANFNAVINCWPTCGTGRWSLRLTFHTKEQCENERTHWKTCHWKTTCYSLETFKGHIPPRTPESVRCSYFKFPWSVRLYPNQLCAPLFM